MKFILLFLLSISLGAQERVISLSPSINEIVFALGLGERIVANTLYCNYPKESLKIEKIGGYASISLEKIIQLKPTIVLAHNYDQKLLSNLKRLNIPTKVFKIDTLASIKQTISTLGEYFNKQMKAQQLNHAIQKAMDSLENIVSHKKILFVISHKKYLHHQIYITGNTLYFEDIIKASGNKNAYYSKSIHQPVVNTEKILHLNPDIIILLAPLLQNNPEEQLQLQQAWLTLPTTAAKNKNIYMIAKEYAGIPSNRVINVIQDFRKILINVKNKSL